MMQLVIELPDLLSIKEKRRIVKSLKDRVRVKFHVSIAEVDLQDSLSFSQIGTALVSNSKEYGEKVMNKILSFVEDNVPGRVHDVAIRTEQY
ncbi:MAG: DUF503 domain-containing protein [Spirochaetaceae bacterium]